MKRLILVLGLLGSPVSADFFDGQELHRLCTSEDVRENQVCTGYAIGVVDSAEDLAIRASISPERFGDNAADLIMPYCVPVGAGGRQLKDIVAKYLTDNPQERHFKAVSLVSLAMMEAFPWN